MSPDAALARFATLFGGPDRSSWLLHDKEPGVSCSPGEVYHEGLAYFDDSREAICTRSCNPRRAKMAIGCDCWSYRHAHQSPAILRFVRS